MSSRANSIVMIASSAMKASTAPYHSLKRPIAQEHISRAKTITPPAAGCLAPILAGAKIAAGCRVLGADLGPGRERDQVGAPQQHGDSGGDDDRSRPLARRQRRQCGTGFGVTALGAAERGFAARRGGAHSARSS